LSHFRLSVNLAPDVASALRELAQEHGLTLSEAVRRAISTEHYLRAKRREGYKVLIEDQRGKMRQLEFVGDSK
jgi:hypothetical protein